MPKRNSYDIFITTRLPRDCFYYYMVVKIYINTNRVWLWGSQLKKKSRLVSLKNKSPHRNDHMSRMTTARIRSVLLIWIAEPCAYNFLVRHCTCISWLYVFWSTTKKLGHRVEVNQAGPSAYTVWRKASANLLHTARFNIRADKCHRCCVMEWACCRWCRILKGCVSLHKAFAQAILYYMDGDLNDKPTAMRSRSMARSQSWTTVYKGPDRLLRMMFTAPITINPEN